MMAFCRAGSDCSRTNLITLRKRVLAGTSGLRASLLKLFVRLGKSLNDRSDALTALGGELLAK